MVVGVALTVLLNVLTTSIRLSIDLESRSLLGADLVLVRREAWDEGTRALLDSISGRRVTEVSFVSMAATQANEGRLVFVRAVSPEFPLYGKIETTPDDAIQRMHQDRGVVVEQTVLAQHQLKVGDSLRIGEASFPIVGTVEQIPGDSPIGELIAPRVFVSERYVEETGLLKFGSRVSYRVGFKLPAGVNSDAVVAEHEQAFDEARLTSETVAQRRRSIDGVINNVDRFLHLGGLGVLVLAGFGIGHGASAFLAQKRRTIALLRCLGANRGWVLWAFIVQMGLAAGVASVVGAGIGLSLAFILPALLSEILPFTLAVQPSMVDVLDGLVLGLFIPLGCMMPALLRCARTPPSLLLGGVDPSVRADFRERAIPVVLLLVLIALRGRFLESSLLLLGIGVSAGLLAILIALLLGVGKRRGTRLPLAIRQAFRHLARPGNQTIALAVGLCFALLLPCVLTILSTMLASQMQAAGSEGKANTVLFGIDPSQMDEITTTLKKFNHAVFEAVPVVTMRLVSIKGILVRDILRSQRPSGATAAGTENETKRTEKSDSDQTERVPEWTLRREYRSTYRDALVGSERILSGSFVPRVERSAATVDSFASKPVPVTIEEGLAEKLGLSVGSPLVFDVQGSEMPAVISGIREVQWQQMRPNFFFVFPEGALNDAPQTEIVTTRTESVEERVRLEGEVLRRFPNVSYIDLQFVLRVLDSVLSRLSLGAKVLAAALSLTAILVALSIFMNDFGLRIRDYALLKVLGAGRRMLFLILVSEYAVVGIVSAVVAVSCAILVSILLLQFVFHLDYIVPLLSLFTIGAVAALLTMVFGIIVSAGLLRASPLAVFRAD